MEEHAFLQNGGERLVEREMDQSESWWASLSMEEKSCNSEDGPIMARWERTSGFSMRMRKSPLETLAKCGGRINTRRKNVRRLKRKRSGSKEWRGNWKKKVWKKKERSKGIKKATQKPRKCDKGRKLMAQRKSSGNCWLSPTVPRSVLRSVGRLNFLPGPFTETKE